LYVQLELLERSYVMVLVAGRVDLDHDAAVELSRTRVVHARER
jgi:sRNA-binding protein